MRRAHTVTPRVIANGVPRLQSSVNFNIVEGNQKCNKFDSFERFGYIINFGISLPEAQLSSLTVTEDCS